MPPVIFLPAARAEMIEAHAWYSAHGAELAAGSSPKWGAVERVAAGPMRFPKLFQDIRRVRLNRFPYGLYFRVEDGAVYILACFHARRDPREWQSRS